MADRGNGIRIFNSKMALEKIFEDFEDTESDDDAADESDGEQDKTAVVTSQLRHFVIQVFYIEYVCYWPLKSFRNIWEIHC